VIFRLSATLIYLSSLCDVVCLSCFIQVFVWFRLSNQFRLSTNPIKDFSVIHVTDPDTWIFWRLEYSHLCRLLYFVVLCY